MKTLDEFEKMLTREEFLKFREAHVVRHVEEERGEAKKRKQEFREKILTILDNVAMTTQEVQYGLQNAGLPSVPSEVYSLLRSLEDEDLVRRRYDPQTYRTYWAWAHRK